VTSQKYTGLTGRENQYRNQTKGTKYHYFYILLLLLILLLGKCCSWLRSWLLERLSCIYFSLITATLTRVQHIRVHTRQTCYLGFQCNRYAGDWNQHKQFHVTSKNLALQMPSYFRLHSLYMFLPTVYKTQLYKNWNSYLVLATICRKNRTKIAHTY
jgi:hypothetical protein